MAIKTVNPATGAVLSEYAEFDTAAIEDAVDAVNARFPAWAQIPYTERAKYLRNAAGILRQRADEFAELMALEMGKPLAQGRAEAEKCAWVCEYYAEHGAAFLESQTVASDAARSVVAFEPLGPVLAVMPWNYPFWQVFRFAAPTLMAGNVALLKHASGVCGCALAIEDIFRAAGFPEDVFRTLIIASDAVNGLIADGRVRAVTLTGSTAAGRSVAAAAGQALKKVVLELGGSDPYIILADADLELAAEKCVTSRLNNSGQSCIAAKRFIVERAVAEQFTAAVVAQMRARKIGDPLADGSDLGPMARADLRDELHAQVRKSVELGAQCLLGGTIPDGLGAYYPPTVLGAVTPSMPAYREELFGPVAAIVSVDDLDAAITTANDSVYGLGAAVFTRDIATAERIVAPRLEAGCCFINDFVRSDPRLPFGGIKESGFGRELGAFGIREFVNVKTIYTA